MSLADDVVELLTVHGPMELEFIRTRLCVASESRMRAAMYVASAEGRVEQFHAGARGTGYRIPGDARELGAGDIIQLQRRRRTAA